MNFACVVDHDVDERSELGLPSFHQDTGQQHRAAIGCARVQEGVEGFVQGRHDGLRRSGILAKVQVAGVANRIVDA